MYVSSFLYCVLAKDDLVERQFVNGDDFKIHGNDDILEFDFGDVSEDGDYDSREDSESPDQQKYTGSIEFEDKRGASPIDMNNTSGQLSNDDIFYEQVTFESLPESSVFCSDSEKYNRTCRVKNLYYQPKNKQFFIVVGNHTLEKNIPKDPQLWLVDMTSIDNHNMYFWRYDGVSDDLYRNVSVNVVKKKSYLLMRSHPGNIMHMIHDALLGLYFTMKEYGENISIGSDFKNRASHYFHEDNYIFTTDEFGRGNYSHILEVLSNYQLRTMVDLDNGKDMFCFPDAIVGISKRTSWYQFGFDTFQGPIENKYVNGLDIREVAEYIMRRYNIPTWNRYNQHINLYNLMSTAYFQSMQSNSTQKTVKEDETKRFPILENKASANIALFSRRKNRLILNEDELIAALENTFGLPVELVREEDMSFESQIKVLKNSIIGVGMHGAILVMGMFMPPGSILIELYPYAVPADTYIPYKTMCNLPGMEMTYASWINTYENNNIPHPEYPRELGGLQSFDLETREMVQSASTIPPHMCCSDPYWLYRIYQDTHVNITEITGVIKGAIREAYQKYNPALTRFIPKPAMIKERPMYEYTDNPAEVILKWKTPFNVPYAKVSKYGIWVEPTSKEYISNTNSIRLNICKRGKSVEVWVRPYYYDEQQGKDIPIVWGPGRTIKCL